MPLTVSHGLSEQRLPGASGGAHPSAGVSTLNSWFALGSSPPDQHTCVDVQLSSSHQAPLIPVLVCHVVHAPHEALLRADKREVGHVACVQARVAFHLVCKAAVLVARLEQLPPHRVELLVVLRQQARMARLEAVSPAPQLIQQLHVFDVALRVARHRVLLERPLVALDFVVDCVALCPQQPQLLVHRLAVLAHAQLNVQLRRNQHRAPPNALFALHNVAVDVVANVEHLVATADAQHAVQVLVAAALEDRCPLASSRRRRRCRRRLLLRLRDEKACVDDAGVLERDGWRAVIGVDEVAGVDVDGEELAAALKEGRLPTPDHDHVKVLEPLERL
mmetsp:Transcript_37051/g.109221  ORF Transcript_37051/g.109221 Transcript_37051/m.109221 type:complete len:334 (-) Transcript_37051:1483-2484(-)